jgi:hypothetical protein
MATTAGSQEENDAVGVPGTVSSLVTSSQCRQRLQHSKIPTVGAEAHLKPCQELALEEHEIAGDQEQDESAPRRAYDEKMIPISQESVITFFRSNIAL